MEKSSINWKSFGDCEAEKTGTKVTFLPDDTIFEETVFDFDVLKQRFREMAFLTAGLKIVLRDERPEDGIIVKKHSITRAVSENLFLT